MGNQAGDCRAARVVRAQNLTQENPQSNERRINPIQPARANRCQRFSNKLLGEDIPERQISVLEKLMPQKIHLLPKPSLVKIPHSRGLLAVDGSVANSHL